MKIELTEQQYKDLLVSVEISGAICGTLNEVIEGEGINYEERVGNFEDLQEYLLQFSDEFLLEEEEKGEDEEVLEYPFYEEEADLILEDFEEFALHERLSTILAWRDFDSEYSEEEQQKMAEETEGCFCAEIELREEKYLNEFDEHGFERLFIIENEEESTPSPYL